MRISCRKEALGARGPQKVRTNWDRKKTKSQHMQKKCEKVLAPGVFTVVFFNQHRLPTTFQGENQLLAWNIVCINLKQNRVVS